MINKKVLRGAVIMILALMCFAGTAQASVDVAFAKIERIGPDPRFADTVSSGFMVQLSDTATSPAWAGVRQFYLSAELGNTGVATLLTAFSLGEFVWVRIGGAAEDGSLISIIFVNSPAP